MAKLTPAQLQQHLSRLKDGDSVAAYARAHDPDANQLYYHLSRQRRKMSTAKRKQFVAVERSVSAQTVSATVRLPNGVVVSAPLESVAELLPMLAQL